MDSISVPEADSLAPGLPIADTTLSAASVAPYADSVQGATEKSDHEGSSLAPRTPEGQKIARPRLGSRKSSGTMIVPADRKSYL